jgi:hypothetical protein
MAGSNRFEGGEGSLQGVAALGTGAVTTQTRVVAVVPKRMRVKRIRFFGQSATTATSLTVQVFARTTAGATGNDLTGATDIDLTAAALKAGVVAVLEATNPEHLNLVDGQLIEATITADTCSAGPGDLLTVVEFEPRFP